MSLSKFKFIVIIATFLFPCFGNAETAGKLSVGGLYQNNDVISKNMALDLSIINGEFETGASLDYGKTADVVSTDKGNAYIGYDPVLNDVWSLWFIEQVGYNKVSGIDLENFIGGGPKYTFWREGKSKASASFGWLMYSKTTETDSETFSRLSFRLKGKRKYKSVQLSGVAFYQPAVRDFNDTIISGKVKATIPLLEKLGLSFALEDEYRSITEAEEKNSLLGKISLEFKF